MTTLWFPPYYPETVDLERYRHVTPFMKAVLIPRDRRAHVFVSKKKMLNLRNMAWEEVSVRRMFQSGMLD